MGVPTSEVIKGTDGGRAGGTQAGMTHPRKDGKSANHPGSGRGGATYGGLVDVLPDVRDELGAVAAC